MAVLGIRRGKIPQVHQLFEPAVEQAAEPDAATPEIPLPKTAVRQEPSAQESSPAKKPTAVSKPSMEKKASVNSAEKAPANKPDNRQPVKTSTAKPASLKPAAPPKLPPKPAHQGTLVFIIDDAGNNLKELEPFLRFPGPLTIAVLPGLPHSAEAARRIRAAGKEVFLHQPMEASGGQDPGPGAIYAGMDAAEMLAVLNQNIAEVGPVAGINNHQGSRITADQQAMETVLAFCRERGISFLDSRTTANTAVPAAARDIGIKIGERNIFIDNEQDRPSMNRSIEGGLVWASQRGSAVMIGHIWSPELAPLLAELYQNVIAQGYTLATASDLINRH
ncbi:MAG: divergent polysaccharide deacetylase family protein [Treponema sp.]|nr:divergent polysaccharide deacetylase family protein [Treponema sp.]